MDIRRVLLRIQIVVYLLETAVLMLVLSAAAGELALGAPARVLAAAAVPLPCHLLLAFHVAWAGRMRPRAMAEVPAPAAPPVHEPIPLPA